MDVKGFTNSTAFQLAMYDLVVGKPLGYGCFRDVYICGLNAEWVVKFQRERCDFDNVKEWEAWQEYKHNPKVAKWLAPCHHISASGDILIQQRTQYLEKLPEKMPSFLTDVKPDNYGFLNGHIVCHDYGFLHPAKLNTRLRTVKWRKE